VKEIQLQCKEWCRVGRRGNGRGEAKTRSRGQTGRSALLSHIGPQLWNCYSEVLQGVGRTQQTGCTSGIDETNRRVFAWLRVAAFVFQIYI
jgi:hypothetical protein